MVAEARSLVRRGARCLRRRGVEEPALEANLLLGAAAGLSPAGMARSRVIDGATVRLYFDLLGLRARRVPLAYLTGEKEFWSLPLLVSPGVLIPRPETEVLVEAVIEALDGRGSPLIADVGTGSGAIAVALAASVRASTVWATDSSPDALEIARANARRHGVDGRIRLAWGNLLEPLRGEAPFDAIVSNPPYVTTADHRRLQPEVRCFEPPRALIGGRDGLHHVRRLIRQARAVLGPGGILACEIGHGQRPVVDRLLACAGTWERWHWVRDLAGMDRVFVATRRDSTGCR